MTTPTPRVLDNRRPSASAPTATNTAAALGAYHAELRRAGLPPALVDELVLAAGRTVIHTNGLTVNLPNADGTSDTVSLAPATPNPGSVRNRVRITESR